MAAAGLRAASGQDGDHDRWPPHGRGRVRLLAFSPAACSAPTTSTSDPTGSSSEEEQFLAARVAGRGLGPTYADLEYAPAVLLVAFEPEDESPIVLLRLRKAARPAPRVVAVAPAGEPRPGKTAGTWIPLHQGAEVAVAASLDAEIARGARTSRASVILVGEARRGPRAPDDGGRPSRRPRLEPRSGGCRGEQVTAVPSKPGCFPPCCPVDGRCPTPPPASTPLRSGEWPRSRRRRA